MIVVKTEVKFVEYSIFKNASINVIGLVIVYPPAVREVALGWILMLRGVAKELELANYYR